MVLSINHLQEAPHRAWPLILTLVTICFVSGCSIVGACANLCVACGGSLANGGGPANGAVSVEVAAPQPVADDVNSLPAGKY